MPPAQASIVYVGNADSQDISIFGLADTGELTSLGVAPIPGPPKPGSSTPLALSPDKRFLYAGLRNEPYSVATFAVDPKTGKLSYLGSGPLADTMAYIAVDRTGRFLLSASYQGSKVAVNKVGPDGVVQSPHQVVATTPNAHCILPDNSNRHVLFTSLGGDVVHQQKFDAETGRLTPNNPPTTGVRAKAGPRHVVFSPDNAFAYLVNELDGSIYVFPYDSGSGLLKKEVQVTSVLPKDFSGTPSAADIHLTPDGRFLYASERTSSTLAAFRVDPAKGTLTLTGNYPTEKQPRGFNIDPSGRYLLAVGQLSDSLTVYAIDKATGALAVRGRYPVGRNPNWVEIIRLP